MDVDLGYAWQKYVTAGSILAAGAGSLRERVIAAYRDSALHAANAQITDLDDNELLARIRALDDQMTSGVPKAGEGTIKASGNAMGERELQHVAEEMFWIAIKLSERLGAKNGV